MKRVGCARSDRFLLADMVNVGISRPIIGCIIDVQTLHIDAALGLFRIFFIIPTQSVQLTRSSDPDERCRLTLTRFFGRQGAGKMRIIVVSRIAYHQWLIEIRRRIGGIDDFFGKREQIIGFCPYGQLHRCLRLQGHAFLGFAVFLTILHRNRFRRLRAVNDAVTVADCRSLLVQRVQIRTEDAVALVCLVCIDLVIYRRFVLKIRCPVTVMCQFCEFRERIVRQALVHQIICERMVTARRRAESRT